MFYTFNQNNSGGSFVFDAAKGISHFVIVEAEDVTQAVARAESIGLYFDGEGDCECCGNRWYHPWDEGTVIPTVYNTPIASYNFNDFKWIKGPECFVHYLSGQVLGIGE